MKGDFRERWLELYGEARVTVGEVLPRWPRGCSGAVVTTDATPRKIPDADGASLLTVSRAPRSFGGDCYGSPRVSWLELLEIAIAALELRIEHEAAELGLSLTGGPNAAVLKRLRAQHARGKKRASAGKEEPVRTDAAPGVKP